MAALRACCFVALVLLACATSVTGDSRVVLYLGEDREVLDLKWDKGPKNLEAQLTGLGFTVERATGGQPRELAAGDAYIIPVQNGASWYSSVEDMDAITSLISSGGLVVILDSNLGKGDSLKEFAAKALAYQGNWAVCKQFATNARTSFGEPKLSNRASSFLSAESGRWPAKLEDAKVTSVMSWAHHQDPKAVIEPLYTVVGDEMKTVAQSFGRVGTPGAVVWLGYSWKDGPKAAWGALLEKLVVDFRNGRYKTPAQSLSYLHPLHKETVVESVAVADAAVEHVVEAVVAVSQEAAHVARRVLQTGTYPSPPSPSLEPSAPPPLVLLPPAPAGFEYVAQDVQLSFGDSSVPTWCNPADGSITDDAEVSAWLRAREQEVATVLKVTLDQVVILNVYCGAKVYPSSRFNIKRRAMLEDAAEVFTHRQLKEMFVGSDQVPHLMVIYPEEHITMAAADLHRQRGAEVYSFFNSFDASAATELDAESRRSLLQAQGLKLDIKVLTLEEAPSPPPRPPNPDGVFDPPSPPTRPPRPPPNPPLAALVAAATNATDIEIGFQPPSPAPPSPSPPIIRSSPTPSPTPSPESSPTPSPTPSPESSPSPSPTPSPESSPSPSPESSPSPSPESSPSPSPTPSPESSPSPSPTPSPSPAKPPIAITAAFTAMPAMGSVGSNRPVVYWTDEDFASQLKPRRALQLVDPNRRNCTLKPQKANNTPQPNQCQKCAQAYKAWPVRNSGPKDATTVVLPLYFEEATQISKLKVMQLFNPSLLKVELLAWPLALDDKGAPVWNVRGKPVYEAVNDEDTTPCRQELLVPVPDRTSGIKLRVKAGGSQQSLGPRLKKTAVSGVLLTFKKPTRALQAAFVGSVTFEGRVLYPTLDVYGRWKPKK